MTTKTMKIIIKNTDLVEKDLGLLFVNLSILSLLLPLYINILSMNFDKKENSRSISVIEKILE
jgi:hypothetical protein